MTETLDFSDALQEIRGVMTKGRLKLQNKGNIVFKNGKTGIVENLVPADILTAQWIQRARGYCLRFKLDNEHVYRYDGFKEAVGTDYDKISLFLKTNYEIDLEKKDLSTRGWNWGTTEFDGNSLNFNVNGKTAFEIPLNNVSHCAIAKNEVSLEFHQNDDAQISLMECRFHIPGDKDNAEIDTVEEFYESVMNKADIIQATGTAIAVFTEMQCLTPRGRYMIKMYPTFLQLHGKTFDYKIPYTTILRMFLLPHGDRIYFVISLDPPIKQGQTRYHFVILLFNKEDRMTLELEMEKEDIEEKYAGKLQKEMTGTEYEIMARVMKAFVNRKITVPGNFTSVSGNHYIGCSYKAATGFLYPLARGFIFVHKPPIHIRFDEISCVNFARSTGSSTRSFDFDIETNARAIFSFVGIEKDEYSKLFDFVITQKQLRVKNVADKGSKESMYQDDMDESDGEEHDAYMERMKAEGHTESADDSTDDDYNLDDQASASSVADEYDSNVATTDSDADSDAPKKSRGGHNNASDMSSDGVSDNQEVDVVSEGSPKKKKVAAKKEAVTRPSRGKKPKRDPTQPKRPMSSYILWLNDNRSVIKEDNPEFSNIDIVKKAGELWKSITPEDKTIYEKKAAEAKERYVTAIAIWKAEQPAGGAGGDASTTTTKAPAKKRPAKKVGSAASESTAGTGDQYKSKEFISSDSDTD